MQAKLDVQPLFATPYARVNLSHVITPEHVAYIKNLKMVQNQQNMISEDLYIFKHPQLSAISQAIHEMLAEYAREVMGISQDLVVTQSWSLTNMPGVGMHAHTHSNSIISGSFYYAPMPEPPARMFFDRFANYQRIELRPGEGKRNLFNTSLNAVVPKQGDLVLFPSEINHLVEANSANEPRHAIAFNSFVKGTIGDYRDVSQLTL